MNNELNLSSIRARKARLAAKIGKRGQRFLIFLVVTLGLLGVFLWLSEGFKQIGWACFAAATAALITALWYRLDLTKPAPIAHPDSLDDFLEPSLLASFKKGLPITPQVAWKVSTGQWQGRFLCNHLLLDMNSVIQTLGTEPQDMDIVWRRSVDLMESSQTRQVDAGTLVVALITTSNATRDLITKLNLKETDVLEVHAWLKRLSDYLDEPHPYFGGIGRDWAAGFTPTLDRFGHNISQSVEKGEGHYHTLAHADVLDGIIHSLSQGSSGVALVGEAGSGKSSLIYALAQRLLKGQDQDLLYYQIVTLNASMILSSAKNDLENLILTLFGEAIHAGNIIIFLDDAKLFFGDGVGAFDMSQVLLPVLQNKRLKIIAAFTPHDFQKLKSENEALASLISPVNIKEPSQDVVMDILEDTALTLEQRDKLLISHQAISEAYKLSGQYDQDLAYPGKAINLLEQATTYSQDHILLAESVQQAIEKMRGVKVSKAGSAETDVLLHLEDLIHKRMINQKRAVEVVAAALRRGRAGVGNLGRPVGSFLFLGPTGVGKTELARSLAATYFGDENQMIRLDMSEYQRSDGVARLLDSGVDKSGSLIMFIRQQPFSVVLLDEVEKASDSVLNLLLQMLDEGQLTDSNGRVASFKNSIIIATSNAGSAEISKRVGAGDTLDKMEKPLIEELIAQGLFKPELINRFDDVVLFRPLDKKELAQVAEIMIQGVNKSLAEQNISVKLTDAALGAVVTAGYDPQFGARPMRRAIQKMVENSVAKKLLAGQVQPGTIITLDVKDLS
ncbi:AAA family ATPase [Candidatus Saccharibacteria bacterium]|nr:AAA family ATPase [Candidatus Saccharibacteria bacterium]